MRVIISSLSLIRVHNCLITMAGVWLGAFMTWSSPTYAMPLLASIAAFLVCAAGNAFNDLVDIEIDRINRPNRILVRGLLSKSFALWLAIACNLLALIVSLFVSWQVTLVVLLAILLLILYNVRFKKIPLIGNIAVACLGGLTFITGGMAVDINLVWSLPGPLIPAVFAFLLHLVREIVKDVEDIEGDRLVGIRSLPQLIGSQTALALALLIFFIMALLTMVPVYYNWFGRAYEILAIYTVDLPLLALLIILWGNPTQIMLKTVSLCLKFAMILGGIALYLSR